MNARRTDPSTSSQRASSRRSRQRAARASLDRILIAASIVGLLVSLYLAIVDVVGASTFCLAGSDCDVVRGSSYGKLLGLPLAVLGVAYFATVLALAFGQAPRYASVRQVVGGMGLGAGVLFLGLQGFTLGMWCPYCLVADAAALVVGARTLLPPLRPSLSRGASGAALSIAVLIGGYAVAPSPAASQPTNELTALADHLDDSGAKFYGAYWCPHCQNQKKMFGAAASRLPYVECDPRGTNAQPAACQAAGVQAFPTWVIDGERREGEVSIADLKRLSRFGS